VQTRRDHVQAYQFATNRLMSALVTGDAGRGLAPFRRASLGAIAGIIVAVLLTGGSLIYGLIDPASAATAWRQQGSIVVDEQTGTRFIYLNGTLDPTANYASAMLAAGSQAAVHDVPHSALAQVPVGGTIGIAGAPETLPSAMLPATWAVCLAPGSPGGVVLDLAPGQHATRSTTGDLMLVADSAGAEYVLFDNTKYPVTEKAALVAFGLGTQNPVSAPAGWLAAIPAGPALAAPPIAKMGQPGPVIAGRRTPIGSVFEAAAAGTDQYYVLLADGLAPLSRTEAALLTASGRTGPVQHVSPSVIAAVPASADRSLLGRLPDLLAGTAYQPSGTALCVRQTSPGSSGATVITDQAATAGPGVIVPAGTGMIVEPPPPRSSTGDQPVYLVTDAGVKYELADTNATDALGYSTVTPQVVPSAILDLIPSGPALSVGAARQAVTQP
jgi:type VII secretion protein EccB